MVNEIGVGVAHKVCKITLFFFFIVVVERVDERIDSQTREQLSCKTEQKQTNTHKHCNG